MKTLFILPNGFLESKKINENSKVVMAELLSLWKLLAKDGQLIISNEKLIENILNDFRLRLDKEKLFNAVNELQSYGLIERQGGIYRIFFKNLLHFDTLSFEDIFEQELKNDDTPSGCKVVSFQCRKPSPLPPSQRVREMEKDQLELQKSIFESKSSSE